MGYGYMGNATTNNEAVSGSIHYYIKLAQELGQNVVLLTNPRGEYKFLFYDIDSKAYDICWLEEKLDSSLSDGSTFHYDNKIFLRGGCGSRPVIFFCGGNVGNVDTLADALDSHMGRMEPKRLEEKRLAAMSKIQELTEDQLDRLLAE